MPGEGLQFAAPDCKHPVPLGCTMVHVNTKVTNLVCMRQSGMPLCRRFLSRPRLRFVKTAVKGRELRDTSRACRFRVHWMRYDSYALPS